MKLNKLSVGLPGTRMPDKSIGAAASPESAKERLANLVVRLEVELDSMIKMYTFGRQALENEMLSGMGYTQQGLEERLTKKLKEFTLGLNSLVETKIKWDKAKKQLAATMTLQEEIDACLQFILSLTDDQRHNLRDRLSDRGIYKWKS